MIIYSNTVTNFQMDVLKGAIADKLKSLFEEYDVNGASQAEYMSWMNSLRVMKDVLQIGNVNGDINVAIEYQIPLTSKRVDFLIGGLNDDGKENIVAIELKQWQECEATNLENSVKTYVGGSYKVVAHPSQQVLSYCQLIKNFNLTVQHEDINLTPCAFLHNFNSLNKNVLENDFYKDVVDKAPLFYADDLVNISHFITKFITKPSERDLFEIIDNGKLKPSKALQDSILNLVDGNEEFVMVDEQQVAYATVKNIVETKLHGDQKYTIIIEGGPGTGKSVIAVQLLCKLLNLGYSAAYVTKNAAPRQVFSYKLVEGHKSQSFIKGLFKSPISFERNEKDNVFDCLLVDEAHRLMVRYGHNQIDNIIKASKINVFFIDEDQRVTTSDIGTKDEIRRIAKLYHSRIVESDSLHLVSQFRCNGSDGYLNFLDNVLEIKKTANISLEGLDYDFRVFDDPNIMRDTLREINKVNNKARMVAGYCYEWITRNNTALDRFDINLINDFHAKWNFNSYNTAWAIDPESFEEVGCIHTCQGLELDYIGVIIGNDLRIENGELITDKNEIAKSDTTSHIRSCKDNELAARLIKNTYKTLMSRGQKGCFVYCENKELADYLRKASTLK